MATKSSDNTTTNTTEEMGWSFETRWCVEGILLTETPLFIGSGEVFEHEDIDQGAGPVEVSACAKDAKGKPLVPGSTFKGCMRQWLESVCEDRGLIGLVFGQGPKSEEDQGNSAKVSFHDCPLVFSRIPPTPLPLFNKETQTYIEAHNCIDRVSGTAAENKLFYQEVVPPGVGFKFCITGRCSTYQELALILLGLEGFIDEDNPITLGSLTHSGRGRLSCCINSVKVMGPKEVDAWLKHPAETFSSHMKELSNEELHELKGLAHQLRKTPKTNSHIEFEVTLRFDSHFLVNDPPTKKEREEAEKKIEELKKKNKKVNEQEIKPPDFRPRTDEMCKVILPASSFRGALRSQAERILRTIGKKACDPSTGYGQGKGQCQVVTTKEDVKNLCLACKLFGAPGWRSPVEITDFKLVQGDYEMTRQEFLAVDRFTGGGKKGAKFNALAIYKPVFKGRVKIDLGRLSSNAFDNGPKEAVDLILFVLRDLIDGDITFGFGASKGYGTCKADVAGWDALKSSLKKRFEKVAEKQCHE